jgi:GTP1/Obg family GTP-binding protein
MSYQFPYLQEETNTSICTCLNKRCFSAIESYFICCFDVSAVPQRTLESQVDFVVHLLNSAMKNKKPVVLVTTKNDEASERYVKEAEKIVARKEYKNNIPLVGTSSQNLFSLDRCLV